SSECQTPPPAVPSQMSLELLGFTATAVARPDTVPPKSEFTMGDGPIGYQLIPWMDAGVGGAHTPPATSASIPIEARRPRSLRLNGSRASNRIASSLPFP